MFPHPKNFCGGNFQDWLEVNLTEHCNGKCSWCIERIGFHPTFHAPWETLINLIIQSGKRNIIFLGGEPTLYKDLQMILAALQFAGNKTWVTTNGSLLTPAYTKDNLSGLTGINISIHDNDLRKNEKITGITLNKLNLTRTIRYLHAHGTNVRLNCNCIRGYVDSLIRIKSYISFARKIGADKVRFSELKQDSDNFVDLAETLDHEYGLNDDPFTCGCHQDTIIDRMPVNFRQMCGLQTGKRAKPDNPQQFSKHVLYYDGKIYDGWQTKETDMTGELPLPKGRGFLTHP